MLGSMAQPFGGKRLPNGHLAQGGFCSHTSEKVGLVLHMVQVVG